MHTLAPSTGHIIEQLRAVFCNEDAPPLGGTVAEIEHRPGSDVALDGLMDGNCPGIVWVNCHRIYTTTEFPAETDNPRPCTGQTAAVIQIGAARCCATVDDRGYPPAAAQMEQDALVGLDDAHRLKVAACKAIRQARDLDLIDDAVQSALEPYGPQGGILAWTLNLSVLLTR